MANTQLPDTATYELATRKVHAQRAPLGDHSAELIAGVAAGLLLNLVDEDRLREAHEEAMGRGSVLDTDELAFVILEAAIWARYEGEPCEW